MAGTSILDYVVDQATYKLGEGEDALEVVYKPRSLAPDLNERFQAMVDAVDTRATGRILGEVIQRWTLTGPLTGRRKALDGDGEPLKDEDGRAVYEEYEAVARGQVIPLDPDVLRFIPTATQIHLWNALQRHAMTVDNPFLKNGKTS